VYEMTGVPSEIGLVPAAAVLAVGGTMLET
jgi:hypothetical protein